MTRTQWMIIGMAALLLMLHTFFPPRAWGHIGGGSAGRHWIYADDFYRDEVKGPPSPAEDASWKTVRPRGTGAAYGPCVLDWDRFVMEALVLIALGVTCVALAGAFQKRGKLSA